jgi:hypothetical protein
MPDFSWKWFWSRVFDEFEARDFFVFLGAVAFFLLIWLDASSRSMWTKSL